MSSEDDPTNTRKAPGSTTPQVRVEQRQVVGSELEGTGLRLARLEGQLGKAAELLAGVETLLTTSSM